MKFVKKVKTELSNIGDVTFSENEYQELVTEKEKETYYRLILQGVTYIIYEMKIKRLTESEYLSNL